MKPLTQFTIISIIAVISMGCSSKIKLNSNWRQQEIAVDGEPTDWQDAMIFVEKKDVSFGVTNDNDFLYVCLVSTDRELLRQIMAMGLTLWFDPEGGHEKTFGIRFPVGMMEYGFMMMRGRGRGQEPDLETMREKFEQSLTKIEVIWPENKDRLLFNNVSTLPGIEAKVTLSEAADLLVYEIKVPLLQTEQHRFAIGTESGKQIGVGFETGELNREELRDRMGRGGFGGRPGGFGGPRDGGRGGFGGRRGGGRPELPEPFKLWAKVQLGLESNSPSALLTPDDNMISTDKP